MTIASTLAITGLLLMQTVDQALAGVVFPSGAGTLTIGPLAMEGNLQIRPGNGGDLTPDEMGAIFTANIAIMLASG